MNYCDNCGDPLEPDELIAWTEVPVDVDSANAGESAVLCEECCLDLGIGMPDDPRCYVCSLADTDCKCDACGKDFHFLCDNGTHTNGIDHYCMPCSEAR